MKQHCQTILSACRASLSEMGGRAALGLALLCVLLLPAGLQAQRFLGGIQGEVTDATGAKIPGATVTAESTETHFKTTGTTNGDGVYSFPDLNPGHYVVTSVAKGFGVNTVQGVLLTAGLVQKIDFKLNAGAETQVVDVTASSPLFNTSSADIATTLSNQEVTDLPNIGRNPFVMATLAAGVINGGSGGYFEGKASQYTNPFSGVAVQIVTNGSGGHNRITLNGIPDDPPERFSGATYTGFVPSPEAVEEVKVQTSFFDAQVGHGNGTVTNTVVRGGTNKIHGAAYYVFQNTYLNANTSEKAQGQSNPTAVQFRRNNDQLSQTGFVFDGPVFIPKVYDGRDKTFFMVSLERYQSHSAQNYNSRVPTAAELMGNFSGLCGGVNPVTGLCTNIQIYDPQSPLDGSGNRTQFFAGDIIPTQRINTTGANLLSYLPAPNVAGSNETTNPNYFSTQTSYRSSYPALIARFDQTLGSQQHDKISSIFFRSGLTQSFPFQGFTKGIPPSGFGYQVYRNTRGGSLDEVHQFSSNLVLDSRFGLTFHPFGLQYPGSSGVNLGGLGITSNLPYASFPGTSESDGYAQLASGAGGQVSSSTIGSLEEILTKTIGHHDIRIGFEGNILRYNVAQSPLSGFGNYAFDRHFTQQNYNIANGSTGDPIAAELLGAFSSVSYNVSATYALQQIYMAPFVQDDWRVTKKLTLNLGLRYDYESPLTERYNKQVTNFCTTCVNPLQSQVAGLTLNGGLQFAGPNNRFPYPRDLNNIQPRVGAAYQVAPGTVVRAGFGIIYFNTVETPIGTGFSQSTSYTNYIGNSTPTNSISNPFPNGVVLPTGSAAGLATGVGQGINFIDPHHVTPKSAQYTLNVQQQLPGSLTLQVAYVGVRPTRLEVNHNIDVLPAQYYNLGGAEVNFLNNKVANPMATATFPGTTSLNAATIAQQQLLLPFPEFTSVTELYSSIGTAPYNALQVQVSKPMRHHYSLQGNLTWDKLMLHNGFLDNYALATGHLYSIQDSMPTVFGNIFGTVELPKLLSRPSYERLPLGGWQVNTVVRLSNGLLIGAPGNVDIIGNYYQPGANFYRTFNPCYLIPTISSTGAVTYAPQMSKQDATGTYNTITACDSRSPNPAFRQRISFTSQTNSSVLNLRYSIHPLADFSVFKQFIVREGVSFEIRGEFFNVLNTPNFPGPNTGLGASNTASRAGSGSLTNPTGIATQQNDARIGQLTARINF